MPSARRAVASGADALGLVGGDDERPLAGQSAPSSRVEERRAGLVEARVGLVEQQEVGIVQERPAEREPLLHPARERRHALVPRLPEPEALEQHPDPLAPLGHAVEPPVEVEVLERGELAVDERLVRQVADAAAVDRDLELARGRREQPGAEREQRRLARAVRAGDEEEVAARPPRGRGRAGRASSRSCGRGRARGSCEHVREDEREEGDADDAVHREERRVEPAHVARRDERVLVDEQAGDRDDAEPVEDADVEAEAGRCEEARPWRCGRRARRRTSPGRRTAPAASAARGRGRCSRSKSA